TGAVRTHVGVLDQNGAPRVERCRALVEYRAAEVNDSGAVDEDRAGDGQRLRGIVPGDLAGRGLALVGGRGREVRDTDVVVAIGELVRIRVACSGDRRVQLPCWRGSEGRIRRVACLLGSARV